MTEVELKPFHSSDYIEDEFIGEFLEAIIKPAGKQPQKDQVVFLFKNPSGEDPLKWTNWGLDKIVSNRADGKNVNNFNQLGITAGCLGEGYKYKDKKYGGYAIRMIVDTDKKTVNFVPSISHKTMHLIPIDPSKNVSKEGEKEFKKFAIEFVESKQTVTAPETPKSPGLNPNQQQALRTKWEAFVLESVTQPITKSDFWKLLKTKEPEIKPTHAWEVLEALKDTLKVGEGGKYSVA